MKEKLLNIIRISTVYPRKILDKLLFIFYLKNRNDWRLLEVFKEKPILIVGNGPSLNQTPLDKIHDDIVSIGMNKINLIYETSTWRPDIITCINGLVISQNKEFFNKTNTILIVPVKAFYLGITPRKNVIYVNLTDKVKINENFKKSVSSGCTVTFTALQLAAYLHPKTVNVVGLDHNFSYEKGEDHEIKKFEGEDINHFSKDYFKGHYWGIPNLKGSEKLYQLSKEYFETKNIPIKDCTVNGKLRVFEKVKIEELIHQ
jgi:hypothetical protein